MVSHGTVSPGTGLLPGADSALAVAAVPATTERARSRTLSGLAALGVVGLAFALLAPTGGAVPEAAAQTVPSVFSLAVQGAQSFVMPAAENSAFPLAERGTFAVAAKPKPISPGLAPYTGGGTRAEWMTAAGIPESDWPYVDYIVHRESSWNPNATNPTSGACGLVQALPCSKVPGNGYNPVDNLTWGHAYATARYGGWAEAYAFWTRNHWW